MVLVEVVFKIMIVVVLAFFFYKSEKPKLYFFFFGIIFFLVALFIQLPFKLLEFQFKQLPYIFFQISSLIVGLLAIVVSEVTKYISLKKYLKTKSLKNGIFFGIGWVGFESIAFISLFIYTLFFSFFDISFNPIYLVSSSMSIWNFIFFLIINSTITMFIIASVIKKRRIFFIYGILFSMIIYLILYLSEDSFILEVILILYSLFTLFNYNRFVK